MRPLLAVPNVSEGADLGVLDAIGAAFKGAGAELLDRHADPDHGRAVFTLAGAPGGLAQVLAAGSAVAAERIDLRAHTGVHPRVGALDVAPLVFLDPQARGAACAEALVAAELIGALGVPVLLYGLLAGGRTRAELRRGGLEGLASRIASGELRPDFGPARVHPSAGATLVAARPPLVAFNVELAPPAGLPEAQAIAARIREGGEDGLAGVRAIGVELATRARAQVSTNVEDPFATPLVAVVEAVSRHAAADSAEIVGMVPQAALSGMPANLQIRGFDPARQVIEAVVALHGADHAGGVP